LLVVASLMSIGLFLIFCSLGIPRLVFSPHASSQADLLEVTKRRFQLQGLIEIAGGVVLIVSLKATGASVLAILNEVAAVVLLVIAALTAWRLKRNGVARSAYAPWAGLALLCLMELVFRLSA